MMTVLKYSIPPNLGRKKIFYFLLNLRVKLILNYQQ